MSMIDSAIAGLFSRYLSNVTPKMCQDYISNNKSLFEKTTENDWTTIRRISNLLPGFNLTYENVVTIFEQKRPDLLATLCSTENGPQWLHAQVKTCRLKLGLDRPSFRRD